MIMTSRVFKNSVFTIQSRAIDLRCQVSTFKSVFENLRFRGTPFLKTSVFDRFSVDGHIQTEVLENALVWTGP